MSGEPLSTAHLLAPFALPFGRRHRDLAERSSGHQKGSLLSTTTVDNTSPHSHRDGPDRVRRVAALKAGVGGFFESIIGLGMNSSSPARGRLARGTIPARP